MDGLKSLGEKRISPLSCSITSTLFYSNLYWTEACCILHSGVNVIYFLLSFWVLQEGCVQPLYLNMLPAGTEVEDTECV